jgi:hypothetical protein
MMHFQGPPRAEALNHTPIRQVNNLLAELIDGKIDRPKVYNNTAVSFFHSGSPRGGLKLVCRPQSLHFHFGTP